MPQSVKQILSLFTFLLHIPRRNGRNSLIQRMIGHMLLVEVMTIGEDFSLTFMQSGRGEKYLNAFMKESAELGIPVKLVGEERYALCNSCIPE